MCFPKSMDDWKRFWSRRDAQFNLGDDGYLVDPESEYGALLNPQVAPVDFLSATRCLVLLGEPGIGKSFAMAAAREAVCQRVTVDGDAVVWLDLHEIGSDQQLNRKLFDAPTFRRWRDGSGNLSLFLDSFDECRVQVNTLPAMLLSELQDCDASRLSLRIACRTADWPESLEAGLRRLFGDDQIEVLELLPLRKVDVRSAARQAGVADADAFLAAVARAGVVPLAIKPTTLVFLVNNFRRDGCLPSSQLDLYRDGCRLLCEETERRLEIGLQPRLTAKRRLAVAGRLASLMVFGNRAAVWTAVDQGDVPDDDATIGSVAGDVELDDEAAFAVDEAVVRETLNTGLFSSRGLNRLGWAHRTYAEFLAADYVVRRDLALPQIMSLIVHAGDPDGKIVPQLHETAAWLANLRPDVFHEIMVRDPEVLLRSDVASATKEDRQALAEALLRGYDAGTLLDDDRGLRRRYAHLDHPSLADQLRPIIRDRAKGLVVRRVSIDMAEQCRLAVLLDELVAVALDPAESQPVRINAAYAVIRTDDPAHRAKLKPLVSIDPNDDPDDELKGCGLQATWPDFLPSPELFAALTPVRGHLFGAYRGFLGGDPASKLPPVDLPLALRWARERIASHGAPLEFQPLVTGIMRRAWDHLDEPGVLDEFAKTALLRARGLEGVFQERGTDQADGILTQREGRLRVVEASLAHAEGAGDLRLLVWNRFVRPEDMDWLLGRLASAAGSNKRAWAELVAAAMNLQDRDAVERVLCAREEDAVLREVLAPWFDPIPLESPEAERARELYAMEREIEARRANETPPPTPPPAERVRDDLDRFAAGDLDAWWRLNFDLMLENKAEQTINEFESDLASLPGWKSADAATKTAILAAAEPYLTHQEPTPETWVGDYPTIKIVRPDWAAFRAFRLLLDRAPGRLDALPGAVWAKWATVIAAYPTLSSPEARQAQRHLVARAYKHAPGAVTAALLLLIGKEDQGGHGYVESLIHRADECWDGALAGALLAHVRAVRFSARALNDLIEALVVHEVAGARGFAEELIARRTQDDERERAAVAAATLLRHPASGGWNVAWSAITGDGAFGEAVLGWVVHDDWHTGRIAAQLSEGQLADAFVWLSNRYPQADDSWPEGAVTFRHAVASWRDDLLRSLEQRGTRDSCAAIQRIMQALPHLDWLKWTLHEAKRVTRQRTWEPPTVAEIRSLVQSRERRLVQNADELLDVVIESLRRFEEKLQLNQPPAIVYLWNETSPGVFEPKEEERLSDAIKIHLDTDIRDRQVIINREVVNRKGEETDILVESIVSEMNEWISDKITLVIEVKGNWNPEHRQGMRTQLVNRYLSNNKISHGLYVIGWYQGEQWNPNDDKRKKAPKYGIEKARKRYHDQAMGMSINGRRVESYVLDMNLPRLKKKQAKRSRRSAS